MMRPHMRTHCSEQYVSRIRLAMHGRTDGLTERELLKMIMSPNASRAGGLNESPSDGSDAYEFYELDECAHSHTPHVYIAYWPALNVIKAGITQTCRWEAWPSRGAAIIATKDTCCMEHARRFEKYLLAVFAYWGAPAFKSAQQASPHLGAQGAGWTECFRFIPSIRQGGDLVDPYDYAAGYGLNLPPKLWDDLRHMEFAPLPVSPEIHQRLAEEYAARRPA